MNATKNDQSTTSGSALTICLGVPTHVVTGQQDGRRLWVRFLSFALNARACAPFVQIGNRRESDENEHFFLADEVLDAALHISNHPATRW